MSSRLLHAEIPSRSRYCKKGNEPFVPGTSYVSVLSKEGNDWIRQDYCEACWGHEQPENKVSFWKSSVPVKQEEPTADIIKTRDERAFELFKHAMTNETYEYAFVLALYLARRRILVARHKIAQVTWYENPSLEEFYPVPQFSLSSQQIEHIQQKIANDLSIR